MLLLGGCGGGTDSVATVASVPSRATANNDSATTLEETPVNIDVTANDTGVEANPVTISTQAANGITRVSNGMVTYLPNKDFFGADSFNYSVMATTGGLLTGTVSVSVTNSNDVPIAHADAASTLINTPVTVDVKANDTDADGDLDLADIEILSTMLAGRVDVTAGELHYFPAADVTGSELITYQLVDTTGVQSNPTTVMIEILPITSTILTVTNFNFPTSGYTTVFSAEFADSIDQSPLQNLTIPPNTQSFALYLEGAGVTESPNNFIVSDLVTPGGISLAPLFDNVEFCDTRLCSLLIPRAPNQIPEAGVWQYRIGSLNRNLNFPVITPRVIAAIRTGPAPDNQIALVSTIRIKPVITVSSVPELEITAIFNRVKNIFAGNGINLIIDTPLQITNPQFSEVSSNFLHSSTRALVAEGDPDQVNVFVLESFSGANGNGLLGISGSIPSPMGFESVFNAVLINGTATQDGDREVHINSTAAVIVHEIGHYLGLAHTTEDRYQAHDYINDTPQCLEDSHDVNKNGIANQAECPDGSNIMFWMDEFDFEKTLLSSDQQTVIHRAPIATPIE